MDFTLTDDQQMLRDSVARYLEKEYDFSKRVKLVADGGISPSNWRTFADLGWTGACLPESVGGYGGAVEGMILMEQFGRHLVVEPFIWSVIVGGQLLQALPDERARRLLERMIAGECHIALASIERNSRHDLAAIATTAVKIDGGWVLNGVKAVVPNGAAADILFVTAKVQDVVALFIIERNTKGLNIIPFQTQDGHNAAEIRFDNVTLPSDACIANGEDAINLIELASDHGRAALCAEAIGSADYLITATTAHLKQREQYGAPLAKLQVLQHRLAEMYVTTELARSMAISATLSLELPSDERKRAISAARVQVIQSLRYVTQQAAQLHGGMGISEELDVAHHLKRAVTTAILLGDESFHLDRFMALEMPAEMAA
jgi:alkylation response protein AidB-like acyl-CoA dehydrogenase